FVIISYCDLSVPLEFLNYFPTRRSSDLACQMTFNALGKAKESIVVAVMRKFVLLIPLIYIMPQIMKSNQAMAVYMAEPMADFLADRKSTRLNSSHVSISYAVFCLKKKKN